MLRYTTRNSALYIHYTKPHYTALRRITRHYLTLHYATHSTALRYPTQQYFTLHPLHRQKYISSYTALITPHPDTTPSHCNYTTTTALHDATSSSCRRGDHCNHCNRSRNTNPTTFRSSSGFALPSVFHNNQPFL